MKIRVKSPSGKYGYVPEKQLPRAVEKGYERADSFETPDISGTPPLNPLEEGTLIRDILSSSAMPIAGGVIGGITGGIPGALLGGGAGEAYRQLGARKAGLPVPETPLEAMKEIGVEGITQGAGEAVGSKIISPVAKFLKKPLGQMFQILTKMKPEEAATLFRNPSAILPGKMAKAKESWRKAAKEIGIETDEISQEMIKILSGDAKKMVFDTYGKIAAGESVSAAEAQTAKQALDIAVMPVAKTIRKNPLVTTLNKIRQTFTDIIGKESPEMLAANKQYAIASAGDKFKSLFPRNTTGDPAYFRSSVLPTLLGVGGAYRGEPLEGAMQGAGLAALTSPLAIGSGIALAGGMRPAFPYVRRAATASLAELFKNKFRTPTDLEE